MVCKIHINTLIHNYFIDTYLKNYLLFLRGNSILHNYYSYYIRSYLYMVFNNEYIKSSEISPSLKVLLLLKYQHVGVICLIMKLSELSPSLNSLLLKSQNVGVICHIMESSKLSPSLKVVLLLKSQNDWFWAIFYEYLS